MHLNSLQLADLESRYRAALVNSLSGFKSANLVGSVDSAGQTNLAIMSSVVHLGSHPPLLALIVRPDSADRHTLRNIRSTGAYTINHVALDMIEAAHQTAARYPREVCEFDATGLNREWRAGFAAPFVAESSIQLGMQLREEQTLAINGTHLVIGEIVSVTLPEHTLREDGSLDIAAAGSVALSGLDAYHQAHCLRRMPYAKPQPPAC